MKNKIKQNIITKMLKFMLDKFKSYNQAEKTQKSRYKCSLTSS